MIILKSDQSGFDSYFVQRVHATGYLRLSNIQKCLGAIHMIRYSVLSDATKYSTRATKNTAIKNMK